MEADDFDVEKAAVRLCRYWKYRKDLFGERWLLPLNQTGTGALNANDIELLRSGSHVSLPLESGGIVTIYDESRLPRKPDDSILRVIYYQASVYPDLCHSCTFLYVVTSARRYPITFNDRWKRGHAALPIKSKQIIVAQACEEGRKELLDYIGYQTKRVSEVKINRRVGLVYADSVAGTLRLLQQRGLDRNCLPISLGGNYQYDQLNEWVRMRLSLEDYLPSLSTGCYRSHVPLVGNITSVSRKGALTLSRKRHVEEDKPTMLVKRERNALYSRRAYQKRKLEMLTLQDQCAMWESRNNAVRAQNDMLEEILEEAKEMVRDHLQRQKITSSDVTTS